VPERDCRMCSQEPAHSPLPPFRGPACGAPEGARKLWLKWPCLWHGHSTRDRVFKRTSCLPSGKLSFRSVFSFMHS